MILEIDFGNTRLKWRLLSSETLECLSYGAVLHVFDLLPALRSAECFTLAFCRACSVRSAADNEQLDVVIAEGYGITVEYAQSCRVLAGVINGYTKAEKLGVDRWLAVVAAYTQIKGASVVIDCGTAITVDFISVDGRHLGGNIAPGLKLLSSMLATGAQLMKDIVTPAVLDYQKIGTCTEVAVAAGVRSMFSGFLKEQLHVASAKLGDSFSVLCTGGDSGLACSILDEAVVEEGLIFKGLAIACPYRAKEVK